MDLGYWFKYNFSVSRQSDGTYKYFHIDSKTVLHRNETMSMKHVVCMTHLELYNTNKSHELNLVSSLSPLNLKDIRPLIYLKDLRLSDAKEVSIRNMVGLIRSYIFDNVEGFSVGVKLQIYNSTLHINLTQENKLLYSATLPVNKKHLKLRSCGLSFDEFVCKDVEEVLLNVTNTMKRRL